MAPMKIYMPEELCVRILVRLPVKSLLRFRSVCKLWKQIISSKSFCNVHLDHNKSSSNRKKYILFNHMYICTVNLIDTAAGSCVNDESSNRWSCLQPKSIFQRIYVYGICNGLLCLSDRTDLTLKSNIYLWNPFTRRERKLPSVTSCRAFKESGLASLAFGYYDDDYKVIRIARNRKTCIVHIYSLSSGQWEFLSLNVPKNIAHMQFSHAMLVNGLACFENRRARQLVYIDMDYKKMDVKMEVVDFPEQVKENSRFIIKAYGESIAFLDFGWRSGHSTDVVMWILSRSGNRDKSIWERRLIVGMGRCYPILGLIDDNKVMVQMCDSNEFMLLNLQTNQFKQLKLRQQLATSTGRTMPLWKIDSFVESLVPLDESTNYFEIIDLYEGMCFTQC